MFTFYPFIEHIYIFGRIHEEIENAEAEDCIDIENETGTVTIEAMEAGNKKSNYSNKINVNNAATMKQSIVSTITEASKNNNYDYISLYLGFLMFIDCLAYHCYLIIFNDYIQIDVYIANYTKTRIDLGNEEISKNILEITLYIFSVCNLIIGTIARPAVMLLIAFYVKFALSEYQYLNITTNQRISPGYKYVKTHKHTHATQTPHTRDIKIKTNKKNHNPMINF